MTSVNAMEEMDTAERDRTSEPIGCADVRLPAGLLGFEHLKEHRLIARPGDAPFCWLQVKGHPSLAFVVIEPFHFLPDYQPDLPQPDVDFLGLHSPEDAAVYVIVTVSGPRRATANLKGPIVINRRTGLAKQVVIANAAQYSVAHPLPVSANAD